MKLTLNKNEIINSLNEYYSIENYSVDIEAEYNDDDSYEVNEYLMLWIKYKNENDRTIKVNITEEEFKDAIYNYLSKIEQFCDIEIIVNKEEYYDGYDEEYVDMFKMNINCTFTKKEEYIKLSKEN